MKQKTASWTPLRVLAYLLLVVVPLGTAGCGVPGFGPQVAVAENAAQALREGQAKADAVAKFENINSAEAVRLRGEAAAHFGAVASKFAGSETGLRALLAQGRLQEQDAPSRTLALETYRSALRQYPPIAFADLHRDVQARYDALIRRLDAENAKTPYYQAIDGLVRLMGGSPVAAIVAISVGVTLALWPLRAKQYRSMKEMQRHAPELKKIQEKYKDDLQLRNEKTMAFYKEHGVNPMAGCLPLIAQMPVLWLLYHSIQLYQFQFARATFLWINETSAAASANLNLQGPLSILNGSIGRNLGEQDLPLLFVYALSMYFQTKLTPVTDPAQAEQQKIMALVMPVMFFVMMLQWHLPSAFVLYWFLSNVLMVTQQWYINRSIVLTPLATSTGVAAVVGNVPLSGNGSAADNGVEQAAKPMTPNQKLISPKNRKRRK